MSFLTVPNKKISDRDWNLGPSNLQHMLYGLCNLRNVICTTAIQNRETKKPEETFHLMCMYMFKYLFKSRTTIW